MTSTKHFLHEWLWRNGAVNAISVQAIARFFALHPRTVRGMLDDLQREGRLTRSFVEMPSWTLHSGHGDARGFQPLTVVEVRDPALFPVKEKPKKRELSSAWNEQPSRNRRPGRGHRRVPQPEPVTCDAVLQPDVPLEAGGLDGWVSSDW